MERIQKVGELAITGASMVVYRAAELEQALDVPVPFFNALSVIVQKIRDHAAAVGENDSSVAEAGRRAGAIREVVERVVNADFPTDSRSLVLILEELAELESIASKWSEKGYWTKRLGVSFSAGTTKACKYDELFRKHFEVVGGCRGWTDPSCICRRLTFNYACHSPSFAASRDLPPSLHKRAPGGAVRRNERGF